MEMEKRELFEDFRARIDEIVQHSDEVETLHFSARLRNGTNFSFSFDADRFERDRMNPDGGRLRPVSVFNSVVDMIGAAIALPLMIVNIASGSSSAFQVLTFTAFFVFFAASAVYHLFDTGMTRTLKVLAAVRTGLLSLSLCLMYTGLSVSRGSGIYIPFTVMLLLAALCIFLTSLATRTAARAAGLVQALIALSALIFMTDRDVNAVMTVALGAAGALIGVFAPEGRHNVRTLGIFFLVALVSFFQAVSL